MKKYIQKLNYLQFPVDAGKIALFFSILAMAYVASASNTKCLSASTCAVGSNPTFEENIGLKGGTAYIATLDASLLTNDRNIQLPDTSGTLAVTASLSGNKMLRTNVSGEIEVDSTTYPVTLSPDLPLYTSATGEVTAGPFDVTSLNIGAGTSNQVLTVNAGGTALTFDTINGVPSLAVNKPLISDGLGALTTASLSIDQVMITDGNGNLSTTTVYPLSFGINKPIVSDGAGNLTDITLNANEPVITDGNGNLATSLIDITTDIDSSSASVNDEIRVGSGGLEFFTPSGGADITKVASGNMIVSTADSQMVIACWYGQHTLDPTKEYTLHIDSGTVEDALTSGYNKFRAQKNDCTSGGGLEFDSVMASMWSVGGRMGNVTSNIVSASYCYGVGGGTTNSIYARASNIAGRFNFRPYKDDDGLNLDWTLTGVNYNNSNVPYGIQAGTGACIVHYSNDPLNFNTITGMHMFLEGNGDTSRTWALYETDI